MEIHKGLNANLTFENPSTVTVTRDSDGEVIVNAVATEVLEEKNVLQVAGTDIPQVDLLAVEWLDTEGTHEKEVEVVGGFVCTVKDIQAKLDMPVEELEEVAPESKIIEQREIATRDIEDSVWDAFRYRYAKETVSGNGGGYLRLAHRNVVEILSVSVDDEALSSEDVANLKVTSVGIERGTGFSEGWRTGHRNITVTYVYGNKDFSPAKNPVVDLTSFRLTPSPNDWYARSTSFTNGEGNTYRFVQEGVRGAEYPLPVVNAFVERYGTVQAF